MVDSRREKHNVSCRESLASQLTGEVILDTVLRIASKIHDPVTASVFAAAFLFLAFRILVNALKVKTQQIKLLLIVLVVALAFLGIAPIASDTYLKSIGMYHVRVVVLGSDGIPVENADVTSSGGEEPKKFESGWEFDIPPQTRPAGAKVVFRAVVRNAFLTGSSAVVLDKDYYPTTTIQLAANSSATVHGIVVDERNLPVAGATVFVTGYPDSVITSNSGSFELSAHAGEGQMVEVRALKGLLAGSASGPAGRNIITIILKRR